MELIYPTSPSYFYRVGLCSPRLFLFQATWHHLRRRMRSKWISRIHHMRPMSTGSSDRTLALKTGVITTQMQRVERHPNRRIMIQRRRFRAFYNAYKWSFIGSVHLWSEGQNLSITVHLDVFNPDRWWRLNASIGRLRPIRLSIDVFFNFVRHSWMYSSNWPIYTPPSLNLSLLISSRLNSASTEWLKVGFRLSIKENSSLEHQCLHSKSRNE